MSKIILPGEGRLILPEANLSTYQGFHALVGSVFAAQGKGSPVSLHGNHRAQRVGGYFGLYGGSDFGGTTSAPNSIANLAAKTVAVKFNPFTSWGSSGVYGWCHESGGSIYAYIKPTSATTIVVSISDQDFAANPVTRTYTVADVSAGTFVLVWNNGQNITAYMGGKLLVPTSSTDASTPTYLRGAELLFFTGDFKNGHGGVHAVARFASALPGSLARYISEDIYNLSPQEPTVFYFGSAGASPITGSLSANESGNDTASFAGDVYVAGQLSATEGAIDTAALSGDVLVKGALAATEGSDTAALTGNVLVEGALNATEGSDTAAFSGYGATPTATGTLAATEVADTAAITGKVYIAGTLSAIEGGLDGFAASGNILFQGTLAASETGADTAAFRQEVMTLTPADLAAIAAAVWADPVAVSAHAKLDAIIARITC